MKSFPDVALHEFPSLGSEEFESYRLAHPIHFVMAHDGHPSSEVTESDLQAKILLRSIIYWFHTVDLNVALVNRIEFRDSKVFTMIIESSASKRPDPTIMSKERKESWQNLSKQRRFHEFGDVDESKFVVIAKALAQSKVHDDYHLTVQSICHVLSQETDVFLSSAFLLHVLLLKHMPLAQRSLPLIVFDKAFEDQSNTFLSTVAGISSQLLEEYELLGSSIDVVDGRLFRVLLQAMCDGSVEKQLSEQVLTEWNSITSVVQNATQKSLSLKGSSAPASSETSTIEQASSHDLSVLPFSSSVFDKHLECIQVKADTTIDARLGSMKLYRETSHWQNYNKPQNPKAAPVQKVSKWKLVTALQRRKVLI